MLIVLLAVAIPLSVIRWGPYMAGYLGATVGRIATGELVWYTYGYSGDSYAAAMSEELSPFGIEVRSVGGCLMSTWETRTIRGHNDAVAHEVRLRFGVDILQILYPTSYELQKVGTESLESDDSRYPSLRAR